MRLTRYITLRSLATRRLRSFLTLCGIVLGVASIFAINFTNQNAYSSISRLFEGTSGRVSLEIRSAANVGGIPEEILETVQAVPQVSQAVPLLFLPAALPDEAPAEMDLNFFGFGSGGLMLHGIDPVQDPLVRDYRVTQGRFIEPDASNRQLVLVENFAVDKQIEVGHEINLLTSAGLITFEVVGLMAKEGAGLTNLGEFGVLDLPVAQEMIGRLEEIDQIDLVADGENKDPAALDALRQSLAETLGEAYAVVYPASQGDRMAQMLSGYQIGLNFMAGIALFVGIFLIYNAFSMTVLERTREMGLLRSVGMTRRQITSQVLLEGLLLGIIGAVAGAATGILLAQGLTSLMAQILGQQLEIGHIPLEILFGSMAIGVSATLLAAFLPAWQAGRISPLDALRLRGSQGDGRLLRYGWIAGAGLLILSSFILIWNPFPYDVQFRLGSMTVFTLFFGATLMIPVTLKAWQLLCRWPLRLIFGNLGEIGSRNLERARKRTMLTSAALMVGVSMIVVTQGMTGSFTADLYAWMDAYAGGDVYVGAAVPMSNDLQERLNDLPGVAVAAPVRYINVTWLKDDAEESLSFMAIDPESYTQVTRFIFSGSAVQPEEALAKFREGGALLISGVLAEKYGLLEGDQLKLQTRQGEETFAVAGVILDFFNQGMSVTGNWADLEASFGVTDVNTFFVKAAHGFDVTQVISQITDGFQDEYQLVVASNSAIKEQADNLMRQAFSLFDVLGILAVLVAALGVLNTLFMSVVERTREIGMLRSMGMSRMQVIRMILAEAGLLGVIGGILGVGFGLALTRIFLAAMGAMSGYDLAFVMPVRSIWLSLVVALVTSQLAALLPAVRAARTPVLTAIHYE